MKVKDMIEHELHIAYHVSAKIRTEKIGISEYELGRLDGKIEVLSWILERIGNE